MPIHLPARRPFGRIRLSTPSPLIQSRLISSTTARPGILGLSNRDLRQQKADEIASRLANRKHTPWLGQMFRPPPKPQPTYYRPPRSAVKACPDPIAHITALQLATLDPASTRTRLFARTNPEAAKVGDILLVRQRNGDPFAGVCLNIRRMGVDTAILLRNQLTRVGVEMWFKIYSPNVEGIEVVERRVKRARRARLYYMRKEEHDRGSVENVVQQYLRARQGLRSKASARKGKKK